MIRIRPPVPSGLDHLAALAEPLRALELQVDRIDAWGRYLARVLTGGGRLLVAGNGGSAAQAQHLTAELVGRYRDERPAMSALALHAETSSLTAIVNDYGAERGFARQVEAHGRPGDVLLALSTSGRSPNLLAAVDAAHACGLTAWALTGPRPNPLCDRASDAVCVDAEATATIQEIHQIVVHMVCAAVDVAIATGRAAPLAVVAEAR
jgi:D-sedoheptulose 7-phosphate isomerase